MLLPYPGQKFHAPVICEHDMTGQAEEGGVGMQLTQNSQTASTAKASSLMDDPSATSRTTTNTTFPEEK